MPEDDLVWRKRLAAYSLVRLGGLVIFFLGVLIMYTNVMRPGGWPQVGAIVAILGIIEAMFMPRLLKRRWDQDDAANQ